MPDRHTMMLDPGHTHSHSSCCAFHCTRRLLCHITCFVAADHVQVEVYYIVILSQSLVIPWHSIYSSSTHIVSSTPSMSIPSKVWYDPYACKADFSWFDILSGNGQTNMTSVIICPASMVNNHTSLEFGKSHRPQLVPCQLRLTCQVTPNTQRTLSQSQLLCKFDQQLLIMEYALKPFFGCPRN